MKPRKSEDVLNLSAEIGGLLYGHGPIFQSAVLADLVATWLAGIQGAEKLEARRQMFDCWCKTMWNLVEVNERLFVNPQIRS